MTDPQTPPKDGDSFFRKVVRFVANPATDWADLNSRQDEGRELDLEKSELKAMIERKKRNDFVRKREFDMLRKVRREGLSPEQLAALGGSSKLDDSESRASDMSPRRADSGVKAKIDEIEQQMVGDNFAGSGARKPGATYEGKTPPPILRQTTTRAAVMPMQAPDAQPQPPARAAGAPLAPPARNAAAAVSLGGLQGGASSDFATPFTVEVSEVAHDPELDEAVIAFANADFDQCEQALTALTRIGGARAQHAETWLVLFDLHRATGQQHSSKAWHSNTRSSSAGPHRSGIRCPSWWPSRRSRKSRAPSAWPAKSAGSVPNIWTSMRWPGCDRCPCNCRCPGSSTGVP